MTKRQIREWMWADTTQFIEAGFQYVTDVGEVKLFRKLKTSYLGS
jgi:hypothetical protein